MLFVFGLGYSALQLHLHLPRQDWRVSGTVRGAEKASVLEQSGLDVQVWTGSGGVSVPDGAHWLVTVPPDADGCPAARWAREAGASAASVTYLSTTGVYGDLAGGWASEWSPVNPQSERAKRRVMAENQWIDLTQGKVRIVRLPGIYGPGRSALDKVRSGEARQIVKPGHVFSRIHVDDIARGLAAMLERPEAHGVFHLCDDLPAPPQDVTAFAAELLGRAPPAQIAFDAARLSPMARSFYAECKRVTNGRAKSTLGWRPAYPSYIEGLRAILAAGG